MIVNRFWGFWASWRVLPTWQIPIVMSIGGTATGRMMRGEAGAVQRFFRLPTDERDQSHQQGRGNDRGI